MRSVNAAALKEWAVICHELARGTHIVLVRKGGIREQSKGFSVDHDEFFLFPTYVHQHADELVGSTRDLLPIVERHAPPAGVVRLELYATVAAVVEVNDLDTLRRLEGLHAFSWAMVERRFHYRRPGLHVIALRVFRLSPRLEVLNRARYDGCRSWVPLESEYPTAGCEPVLSDAEFDHRAQVLREALRA